MSASHKFIQKLWGLHNKILDEIKLNHSNNKNNDLTKFTNKFIKKITDNLNNFSYNIVVANMHEMYAFLFKELDKKYSNEIILENYQKILICITPIIPHFSNECLDNLGCHKQLYWPTYDEKLIEEKNNLIVVQINGKKRGLINLPKNSSEDKLFELIMNDEKLFKYIKEKNIKKKIFIKNKLINIII